MSRRYEQGQDIIKREYQGDRLRECGVDLFSLGWGKVAGFVNTVLSIRGSIQGAKSRELGDKKDFAPNSYAFHYNLLHHPARRCTRPGSFQRIV